MKSKLVIASIAISIALAASACGGDDAGTVASNDDTRTVKIEMRDIAYSIKSLDVKKGETIKFTFDNAGKVDHDAFVGDEMAQADHEKEMSSGSTSDMSMDRSADSNAITVKPGKTGELTYTFDKAGTLLIGCHEPGHYEAGMKITVTVA